MTTTEAGLAAAGERLGELLTARNLTIATAESCTGGWVAKVLTDRAGSSGYVVAGLVTYSNEAKRRLLGVGADTLQQFGAVSEPVVRQMVAGALQATDADVAVAISGIAGPGGGSDAKPVGTVWFAWGSRQDIRASICHFDGDRDAVRRQAVLYVLQGVTGFVTDD
ncbi:CinA family protein [Marinobacter profundi]|uniref:Damage-inducible protein CinA n=1 Tax=Marinobacter profundi TaxID=2666256 RepID=A0A2G1URX0_9GAMM|nr:nicotinamide-nucleotide amidohydrolase family protein [Marinobacter profundi]PHQ17170.1 damage-inducible protein CinA [Marinobacter profundi]